jgi:hypothetical protein
VARGARSARALLCVASLLASQGCEGELLNLGRSQGLTGGEAGGGAVGGVGAAGMGGTKTWFLQDRPIIRQEPDILLANPTLTRDRQQLFFTEQPRYGADTSARVRRAEWTGTGFGASAVVVLGELSPIDAASPAISEDGTELWLGLNLESGRGGTDIWLSRGEGVTFGAPELVSELSSVFDDAPRPPALGGTVMPLSSKRHGGNLYQIYLSTRSSPTAPWGEPSTAQLETVNGAGFQSADGFLADEGRELYFASNRAAGQSDIYVARRSSSAESFGEPALVPDINSPISEERMPWLSEDGMLLFFASNRSGAYALYVATR